MLRSATSAILLAGLSNALGLSDAQNPTADDVNLMMHTWDNLGRVVDSNNEIIKDLNPAIRPLTKPNNWYDIEELLAVLNDRVMGLEAARDQQLGLSATCNCCGATVEKVETCPAGCTEIIDTKPVE